MDMPDQVLRRDSWSTYTSPKDGRAGDEDPPGHSKPSQQLCAEIFRDRDSPSST